MRFVHLTPVSAERSISRAGLRGARASVATASPANVVLQRAVYAMPVVADFWTTFQWLRELRRGHDERLLAVYFRVPDDEAVYVGRYNQPHVRSTAAKAATWVLENPAGAQVILPRSVPASAILSTRRVNQLVGWTEIPETDEKWSCVCSACLPSGDRNLMRRVRSAFAAGLAAARSANTMAEKLNALGSLETPLERGRDRLDHGKLLSFSRSVTPQIRRVTARLLGNFGFTKVRTTLQRLSMDTHVDVRRGAVESLLRAGGAARAARALAPADSAEIAYFVELLEYESDAAKAIEVLESLAHHRDARILAAIQQVAAVLRSELAASRQAAGR